MINRQYVAVAVIVFGLSVTLGWFVDLPGIYSNFGSEGGASEPYVSEPRTSSGPELALIYIGSSTCPFSNMEYLPAAIEQLKMEVSERARSNGLEFSVIGVTVDWSTEAGWEHLKQFGHFDEIMTGRGWLNIGALKYMVEEFPGVVSTPQVLVVHRHAEIGDSTALGYQAESLLFRRSGARRILNWVENGAPLPTIPSD